jgi:hypothetical protein
VNALNLTGSGQSQIVAFCGKHNAYFYENVLHRSDVLLTTTEKSQWAQSRIEP